MTGSLSQPCLGYGVSTMENEAMKGKLSRIGEGLSFQMYVKKKKTNKKRENGVRYSPQGRKVHSQTRILAHILYDEIFSLLKTFFVSIET